VTEADLNEAVETTSPPSGVAATFVFADIAGFTALTEAHGDHEAATLVAEFCTEVKAELAQFGGTHVKSIGDALMLRVHEPADAVVLTSSATVTSSARPSTWPPASQARPPVARSC
jgi:class 3 adenylate cyclase